MIPAYFYKKKRPLRLVGILYVAFQRWAMLTGIYIPSFFPIFRITYFEDIFKAILIFRDATATLAVPLIHHPSSYVPQFSGSILQLNKPIRMHVWSLWWHNFSNPEQAYKMLKTFFFFFSFFVSIKLLPFLLFRMMKGQPACHEPGLTFQAKIRAELSYDGCSSGSGRSRASRRSGKHDAA